MSAALLLLALAALAALASCEPRGGCTYDLDCAALEACVDGVCEPLDLAAYRDGLCAADRDCSAGERCIDGRCRSAAPEVACVGEGDPSCGDELCTVDPAQRCDDGTSCEAVLACLPAVGALAGLFACGEDAACAAGVCAAGVCLRTCGGEQRCPFGFLCEPVALADGRTVDGCVGGDSPATKDPARTLCGSQADCAGGRTCRFLSTVLSGPEAVAVCVEHDEGAPSGARCLSASECRGGGCTPSCQSSIADVCDPLRCSEPCSGDEDCPDRTSCQLFVSEQHVEHHEVHYCVQPLGGCYDDVDCCPSFNGVECRSGWSALPSYCTPRLLRGHLLTLCELEEGLGVPGDPCAVPEDCSTRVCVPTSPAVGLMGTVCSSACEPELDRCAEVLGAGSVCTPTELELEGSTFELPVCR